MRIFQSKILSNSDTSGYEFIFSGATLNADTTRTGAYSIEINNLVSSNVTYFYVLPLITVTGNTYARFYFRIATAPSADNIIFNVTIGELGAIFYLALTSSQTLKLLDTTLTQIGSASSALTSNTWYKVEVRMNDGPSAGSQELELRLEGVTVASSSSQTFVGNLAGSAFFNYGGNLIGESQTQGRWFFDDIVINDATGSANTSWPTDAPLNNSVFNRYGNIQVENGMSRSEGAT